jgi:hypothetical protein
MTCRGIECSYSFTIFSLDTRWRQLVSFIIPVKTALNIHLCRRLSRSIAGLDTTEMMKMPFLYPEFNLDSSVIQPIT